MTVIKLRVIGNVKRDRKDQFCIDEVMEVEELNDKLKKANLILNNSINYIFSTLKIKTKSAGNKKGEEIEQRQKI